MQNGQFKKKENRNKVGRKDAAQRKMPEGSKNRPPSNSEWTKQLQQADYRSKSDLLKSIADSPLGLEDLPLQPSDSTSALLKADSLLRATKQQLLDVQFAIQDSNSLNLMNNMETASVSSKASEEHPRRHMLHARVKGFESDYKAHLLSGPLSSEKQRKPENSSKEHVKIMKKRNSNNIDRKKINKNKPEQFVVTNNKLSFPNNKSLQQEIQITRGAAQGTSKTRQEISNISDMQADVFSVNMHSYCPDSNNTNAYIYQEDYVRKQMQLQKSAPYYSDKSNYSYIIQPLVKQQPHKPESKEENESYVVTYNKVKETATVPDTSCYCSNCIYTCNKSRIQTSKQEVASPSNCCDCEICLKNKSTKDTIWQRKQESQQSTTSRKTCSCIKAQTYANNNTRKDSPKNSCGCPNVYTKNSPKNNSCGCPNVCTCTEKVNYTKCTNSAMIHLKTCTGDPETLKDDVSSKDSNLTVQMLPSLTIKRNLSVQKIPSVRIPPPGSSPYCSPKKNVALWGVSHSQIELELWSPSEQSAVKDNCERKSEQSAMKDNYDRKSECEIKPQMFSFSKRSQNGGKKVRHQCNLVYQRMPAMELGLSECSKCNITFSGRDVNNGQCSNCNIKSQNTYSAPITAPCKTCKKVCSLSDLYSGVCKGCYSISVCNDLTQMRITTPTPDLMKAAAHLRQCDECHKYFPKSELFQGHCVMCQLTKKDICLYQCDTCLNSVPSTEYFEGKCNQCQRSSVMCEKSKYSVVSSSEPEVINRNLSSVFDGTPFLFDINIAQGINTSPDQATNNKHRHHGRTSDQLHPKDLEKIISKDSIMVQEADEMLEDEGKANRGTSKSSDSTSKEVPFDSRGSFQEWWERKKSASSRHSAGGKTENEDKSISSSDYERMSQKIEDSDTAYKEEKRHSKVHYVLERENDNNPQKSTMDLAFKERTQSKASVQFDISSSAEVIDSQNDIPGPDSKYITFDQESSDTDASVDSDYEREMVEKRTAFKRRATPYFGKKEADRLSTLFSSIIIANNGESGSPEETDDEKVLSVIEHAKDNLPAPVLNKKEFQRLSVAVLDVLGDDISSEGRDSEPRVVMAGKEIKTNKTVQRENPLTLNNGNQSTKTEKQIQTVVRQTRGSQTSSLRMPEILENHHKKISFSVGSVLGEKLSAYSLHGAPMVSIKSQPHTINSDGAGSSKIAANRVPVKPNNTDLEEKEMAKYVMNINEDESVKKKVEKGGEQSEPETHSETEAKVEESSVAEDKTSLSGDDIYEDDFEEESESESDRESQMEEEPESKNTKRAKSSYAEYGHDTSIYTCSLLPSPPPLPKVLCYRVSVGEDNPKPSCSKPVQTSAGSTQYQTSTVSCSTAVLPCPGPNQFRNSSTASVQTTCPTKKIRSSSNTCEKPYSGTEDEKHPFPAKTGKICKKPLIEGNPSIEGYTHKQKVTEKPKDIKTPTPRAAKKIKKHATEVPSKAAVSLAPRPHLDPSSPSKKALYDGKSCKPRSNEHTIPRSEKNQECPTEIINLEEYILEILPVCPGITVDAANSTFTSKNKDTSSTALQDTVRHPEKVPCDGQICKPKNEKNIFCPRMKEVKKCPTEKLCPFAVTEVTQEPSQTLKEPLQTHEELSEAPEETSHSCEESLQDSENSVPEEPLTVPDGFVETADATTSVNIEYKDKQTSTMSLEGQHLCPEEPVTVPIELVETADATTSMNVEYKDNQTSSTTLEGQHLCPEEPVQVPIELVETVDATTSVNVEYKDKKTSSTALQGQNLVDRGVSALNILHVEASTSPMSLPSEAVDSKKEVSPIPSREYACRCTARVVICQSKESFTDTNVSPAQMTQEIGPILEKHIPYDCKHENPNHRTEIITSQSERIAPSAQMVTRRDSIKGKDYPCNRGCKRDCAQARAVSRCKKTIEKRTKGLSFSAVPPTVATEQTETSLTSENHAKPTVMFEKKRKFGWLSCIKPQHKQAKSQVATETSSSTTMEMDMPKNSKVILVPSDNEILIPCSTCSLEDTGNSEDETVTNTKSSSTNPFSTGELYSCECIDSCCLCSEGEIIGAKAMKRNKRHVKPRGKTTQNINGIEIIMSSDVECNTSEEDMGDDMQIDVLRRMKICRDCCNHCHGRSGTSEGEVSLDSEEISEGQIRSYTYD